MIRNRIRCPCSSIQVALVLIQPQANRHARLRSSAVPCLPHPPTSILRTHPPHARTHSTETRHRRWNTILTLRWVYCAMRMAGAVRIAQLVRAQAVRAPRRCSLSGARRGYSTLIRNRWSNRITQRPNKSPCLNRGRGEHCRASDRSWRCRAVTNRIVLLNLSR